MMHELLSCDTLAVAADNSACRSHMMAKNSDRPIGEAQPLQWFPPADHTAGEMLVITGMEIPQVSHTYGVLGSKPYWMYGFEMGVNDQGVVIGNEAENSRDKDCEKKEGILGMDLLRLGLERGATARKALDVIVALLEEYGQLRNASALYQSHYENSYIIMDPQEIWVLETAGRRYAAKRVTTGVFNIGNCYTLEKDLELASPDLEAHARENGWLLPDEPFNFSKAYMKDFAAQTLAIPRWRRVRQLSQEKKLHDLDSLKAIFRDHYEGDPVLQPRYGASTGYLPTVCRHALQWDMSQTASSMIAWYQDGIGTVVREAYSQPCCSLYLPAYPGVLLPAEMAFAEGTFSEDSLWWQMDRLAKIIGIDYDRFAPRVQEKAKKIEAEIEAMASVAEKQAAGAEDAEKERILSKVMAECSTKAGRFAREEYRRIKEELQAIGVRELCGPRADFLKKYAEVTKMDIL
ncbi:C69 family dipeptidase [Acidaminococcus fermentans]|uniref:C69 family dipeptidase n=1 Tax=Acidaminococcus fermentans TaxID=905 RepID=UPI00242FEE0B|nr:C69 family dipeptidase [Acidaminococcus fermentans]